MEYKRGRFIYLLTYKLRSDIGNNEKEEKGEETKSKESSENHDTRHTPKTNQILYCQ